MSNKKRRRAEHWKHEPEKHDFPAAADYLSLFVAEPVASAIIDQLRAAETATHKAKDLLRAGRLSVLPVDNFHVAKDLRKVAKGELLSPVLLVRGRAGAGVPLIVADGYHRVCASYHLDEDADIPCRIADLP